MKYKEKFKSYIENKFTEGMTWENYGKWHLDHIKPLYLSENEEDLIKYRGNLYKNLISKNEYFKKISIELCENLCT